MNILQCNEQNDAACVIPLTIILQGNSKSSFIHNLGFMCPTSYILRQSFFLSWNHLLYSCSNNSNKTATAITPQQFVSYRYDHTGACRFSLFPATLCHSGQHTSSNQLKGDIGYFHMNYPLNTLGYSCQMDALLGRDPFFFSDTESTLNLQWTKNSYKR